MSTNCRVLTLEEQAKLWVLMKSKKITQIKIARRNKLVSTMLISKVCRGKYNVTPKIEQQFKNAGINLNEIMGE